MWDEGISKNDYEFIRHQADLTVESSLGKHIISAQGQLWGDNKNFEIWI